ncbi:MAG: cyclic nucleotide-binding domain-containing protein [Anaerolineae bacterium]|nr:cyclic nucleotide-binding domain-containing protein [Anaerolineae bacterium]
MAKTRITPAQLEHLLTLEPANADAEALASNSRILQAFTVMSREALSHLITEETAAPGDIIFREGDHGETMYVIWSGRALVIKGDPVSPTVLSRRGPGEIIGEMALLEGQPRSASVIALDNMRMLSINRDGFHQLLADDPGIGMHLMAILSARLREADVARCTNTETSKKLERRITRLRTEKARLQEIQRVREETTDLVIHDLRNPLSIIISALQMLTMTLPPEALEPNRELLNLANNSSRRMERLIHALLDTARMEAGEEQFNFAPLDLRSIVEISLHNLPPDIKTKGPEIKTEFPEVLPLVTADLEKIERVIQNLLDNALKHTPSKGRITIAIKPDGDHVTVSINDTGIGIPRKERERIFERFSQVGDTKTQRSGFGLGLTFCKLAIRAHDGDIWAEEGANGVGSRFIFTLPIAGSNPS